MSRSVEGEVLSFSRTRAVRVESFERRRAREDEGEKESGVVESSVAGTASAFCFCFCVAAEAEPSTRERTRSSDDQGTMPAWTT